MPDDSEADETGARAHERMSESCDRGPGLALTTNGIRQRLRGELEQHLPADLDQELEQEVDHASARAASRA